MHWFRVGAAHRRCVDRGYNRPVRLVARRGVAAQVDAR